MGVEDDAVRSHNNHNQQNFSLTEFTIVCSILFIFSGLIVQSLLSAHRTSVGLHCLSNLKQLGVALHQYSENNNGLLPHEDFGATQPPHDLCWFTVLQPELNHEDPELILQDPSLTDLHDQEGGPQGFSFKFNSRLEDYKGNKSFRSAPFRHMNSFEHPDQSIIFFDGDISPSHKNKPYGMYLQVVNRHNNKANFLCADGAVHQDNGGFDTEKWKNPGNWIWDPDTPPHQQ